MIEIFLCLADNDRSKNGHLNTETEAVRSVAEDRLQMAVRKWTIEIG